jgi:hypothetical protein
MKRNLITAFLALVLFSFSAKAQNNSGWDQVFLTVSGGNILDGVEAWYQQDTCNGANVVYVRFVNTNPYSAQVSWNDGIFTQDEKWDWKLGTSDRKSVVIPAQVGIKGECTPENALTIKLSDFGIALSEFKRYGVQNFTVLGL